MYIEFPDAKFTSKIKEGFNVDVYAFRFSPKSLAGVLGSIRSQLITKLISISSEESIQKQESFTNDLSLLHPTVKAVSGELFKNGHYRQAILDAYISLVEAVRSKSKQSSDGTQLMQKVFSKDAPILKVSDDPDERLGFMWLFSGAVMGIRNPKAHRIIEQNDPQRALEWLSFASVMFRVLDDAELTTI